MWTQEDREWDRQESRRKAQMDREAELDSAYQDGLEEGRAMAGQISMIHFCERLLGTPETPTDHLAAMSLDDLNRMADELQGQLQKR